MRIADRYIFRELLTPFFTSMLALLMMLVGNTLYQRLEVILRERWPLDQVARLLILNVPTVLVMALPVSTAFATALATSRMSRDNEVTVLRGVGSPLRRFLIPLLIFGTGASLINLYLFDRVTPWAAREQQNVQAFLDALPTNPVDSSRRIRAEDFTITFASSEKLPSGKRRISHVVLVENAKGDGTYPPVITADSAEYANGLWRLKGVVYRRFDTEGMISLDAVAREGLLSLRIDLSGAYFGGGNIPTFFINSYEELTYQAAAARKAGNLRDARRYEVDRWYKLSFPLMGIVFAFVSPLLSHRFAKTGAFTGVLLSLAMVVAALIVLLTLRVAGQSGYLPPLAAAWLPVLVFSGLGVWLLSTQE